jgi:hypothetical protein
MLKVGLTGSIEVGRIYGLLGRFKIFYAKINCISV